MKLDIYNENFQRILIVENNYVSALWEESYNEGGKFTLELQYNQEYHQKIQIGYYVINNDVKTIMIITGVYIEGNIIIASGVTATQTLNKIGWIGTISSGTAIQTAITSAYNSTRKNEIIDILSSSVTDRYYHDISHRSISELIMEICQSEDVGFKAVKNGNRIGIQLYKPSSENINILSDMFGNVGEVTINMSDLDYKNYAIVLGEGEGNNRVRVDVDETNGAVRYDVIVDAKDLQKEEGETDTSYKNRLIARGHEYLLEHNMMWEFDCKPVLNEFNIKYGLGDVITIVVTQYNMKLKARVVKYSVKSQGNKEELTVEIGQKYLI